MKNLRNILFVLVGFLSVNYFNALAAIDPDGTSTATNITNPGSNMIATIENLMTWLIGLLYLIAVIFGIYAGFQILTAGGDEEKVKKGKSTLINVVIGIIVIFLASVIVNWIIGLFATGGGAGVA